MRSVGRVAAKVLGREGPRQPEQVGRCGEDPGRRCALPSACGDVPHLRGVLSLVGEHPPQAVGRVKRRPGSVLWA